MIDRTTQVAQTAAEGLSRRHFLGRVAHGAGLAATALGGVLLAASNAHAKGRRCYVDSDCHKGEICIYLEGYWDGGWSSTGTCTRLPKGHNK